MRKRRPAQIMKPKLPVGVGNFAELRQGGYLFIDKSMFIHEILEDPAKALLITRPRRFGKSLNLSMLAYFLDSRYRDQSSTWFERLAITAKAETMRHRGKTPVIFLDLKNVDAESYDGFLSAIAAQMLESYQTFPECMELRGEMDGRYNELIITLKAIRDNGMPTTSSQRSAWEGQLKRSLLTLTKLVKATLGTKPYILIDEYDAPIQEAYLSEAPFHTQVIAFIKHFLGGALKGNDEHLENAVLTGVMRVSLTNLFSGANNVKVRSSIHRQYSSCFGFTQQEVDSLFRQYFPSQVERLEGVERWYDGYRFGDTTSVYNPVSIIEYIDNDFELGAYWTESGHSGLIGSILDRADQQTLSMLHELMERGDDGKYRSIPYTHNTRLVYKALEGRVDSLWGLMLYTGCLTHSGCSGTPSQYRLVIPNLEVLGIFQDIAKELFARSTGVNETQLGELYTHLSHGRVKQFCDRLQHYMLETASSHDFLKGRHQERFYHVLMLGLFFPLQEHYYIESNRERSLGRPDLLLIPRDVRSGNPIIAVELKTSGVKVGLTDSVAQALDQIVEKRYTAGLFDSGVRNLVHLGMAFHGREMSYGIEKFNFIRRGSLARHEDRQIHPPLALPEPSPVASARTSRARPTGIEARRPELFRDATPSRPHTAQASKPRSTL